MIFRSQHVWFARTLRYCFLKDHMFVKQGKPTPLPHQLQGAAVKVPPVHTLQQLKELDITLLLNIGLGAQGLLSGEISSDP